MSIQIVKKVKQMCSIFGILNYRGTETDARALALKQSDLLKHRGPDAHGIHSCDLAVLVHNRISIIDVSDGDQPFVDESGTVCLVANAEIYNHEEIRERLPSYPFTSDSDCEPLLALYKANGPTFLDELTGMFAFIVVDQSSGKFLVARDHMGIMSLFYGYDSDGALYVASEQKALQDVCCTYHVFPPGHYMTEEDEEPVRYYIRDWHSYDNVKDNSSDKETLRKTLEATVESHLMSDVPFGLLLSGGLDSSLIASIAVHKLRERGTLDPNLASFSIGLQGSPDLKHARELARFLKIPHHEHIYTVEEGVDALSRAIWHIESYDVTTVRASTPMYMIAQRIRARGIKMVLTGDGADEAFGGYLYFHKAPDAQAHHEECLRKLAMMHQYDCLRVNKTLLAWGVEPRVPFLDKTFLDVAMRINPVDKQCGPHRMEKHILRECFADYMPDSITWRQKEQSSDGVGYNWIDTLQSVAEQRVSDARFAAAGHRFPHNTPRTKEAYLYREIFERHFSHRSAPACVPGGKSAANASAQAAEWLGQNRLDDPSGRAILDVHLHSAADERRVA